MTATTHSEPSPAVDERWLDTRDPRCRLLNLTKH